VSGDGIKSGLLATYQSTFVVDTRGAGPGQLTVKVRGRKGNVRLSTRIDVYLSPFTFTKVRRT